MAGIIKSGELDTTASVPRTAEFNFEDMSVRANEYLEVVRGQARKILEEAKADAAKIAGTAKTEGRQAALQEAQLSLRQTLDQQLTTLMPALQAAVQDIRHAKSAWTSHWESQTIDLATAIAERIIRREVQHAPEITIDLIRDALELAMGAGHVTIQLSPHDHEALHDRTEQLVKQLGKLGTTNIVADASVSPGGCRVVTEFGIIDETYEAQLNRIAEELACQE